MKALIFAMLVATGHGQEPDNQVAFLTEDGPKLCQVLADALNATKTKTVYVCEVYHG